MDRAYVNKFIKPYSKPSSGKSTLQIINTVIPYIFLVVGMYFLIRYNVPYVVTLLVSFIASLFLVRVFILFHDCTHNSFLSSRKAMSIWGHIFGILTFTSFYKWQKEHLTHHKTVGNIEKRGVGDVWTMTVKEYDNASSFKRFGYRLYRSPLILFLIGPLYIFLINQRFPSNKFNRNEWISLAITNFSILSIILLVTFTIGFKYYIMIQFPIILFASSMGVWLFYVQHQYEEVYWENNEQWSVIDAAMHGSSVYKLPFLLDWFTGYIGYHNIHHLNAKIPNYNLKKVFHSSVEFRKGKIVTELSEINKEIDRYRSLMLTRSKEWLLHFQKRPSEYVEQS
jgi:omega-6 fatty acid desaturase (delta-12 desaturase)